MTNYELTVLVVEVAVLVGVWLNTTINIVRHKNPPKD